MKVLQGLSDLINELFDSVFLQLISAHRNVLKHVLPLHVFKYHIVVFIGLEQVTQANNVLVLAHFENVNLSALLKDFN